MENKCLKKSTLQQLHMLVACMEENPDLARGTPVFGANKFSVDEQWKKVSEKLNALGPPTRSIAEWKKTWADLKCRTKKKIAENNRSLQETGGGLYKCNPLTALEQVIDRTLLLSSAAVPSGRVYGGGAESGASQSINDCFQLLVELPPSVDKAVAVVTPTRLGKGIGRTDEQPADHPQVLQLSPSHLKNPPKHKYSYQSDGEDKPTSSSAKKRKTAVDEQLLLIRRQLRVAEKNAATATYQADAITRLANAAEVQAESAKRRADAAEVQVSCMKAIMESMQRMENKIEILVCNIKK